MFWCNTLYIISYDFFFQYKRYIEKKYTRKYNLVLIVNCNSFILVQPAATLVENHFQKILIKPIAISPSNQQIKWDDSLVCYTS